MKSVLLYANEDVGFESRLQAALDHARVFDGRLVCLQVTPFNAFIVGDPFGGTYALPVLMERIRESDDAHRNRIEDRLRGEGVSWEWVHLDGEPAQLLVDRSRLADLIVCSLPAPDDDGPLSITGDVAVHARTPVLAVPRASRSFDALGTAVVAWNGSPEAANALKAARPLIERAGAVRIVVVTDDAQDFPPDEACRYLADYGLKPELHEWPRDGRSVAEALLDAAAALGAAYIVMGAYGHTRFREAVLGGCTREALRSSSVPLLLAH